MRFSFLVGRLSGPRAVFWGRVFLTGEKKASRPDHPAFWDKQSVTSPKDDQSLPLAPRDKDKGQLGNDENPMSKQDKIFTRALHRDFDYVEKHHLTP